MKNHDISPIVARFGLKFDKITNFYDTSKNDNDRRLCYILDDRYVLKLQSSSHMTEAHLQRINRLLGRYRSIGVYCPAMFPTVEGTLSCPQVVGDCTFACFVEEFSPYPICGDDFEPQREEVVAHLGVLASKFSGFDLWKERSMWSVIDLSPLDSAVDEKQENADDLEKALREAGLPQLADRIRAENLRLRQIIQKDYKGLPCCVYQGDLNNSNLLLEDGHFQGLIDFNLAGTEVNINVFINETNWFPETTDFDTSDIPSLLTKIHSIQQDRLTAVLANYTMNELEVKLFPYYKRLTELFQYPNVCSMISWLKDPSRQAKAITFIELLLEKPLSYME